MKFIVETSLISSGEHRPFAIRSDKVIMRSLDESLNRL